ncbi:MAG: hypothetical protein Q8R92_11795 [Deltaproteobacteria bacterium]|nr:hypothetical protein [Deltaproteobacteria bacterium]
MATSIGTLAWVRETGGRMRPRDVLGQLGRALVDQARLFPPQLLFRLGLSRPRPLALDPRDIKAPDSRVALEAEQMCREAAPPFLLNHCLRTYLWGRLLAAANGLTLDDELFYVASLLHDQGLIDKYAGPEPGVECFTLISAGAARNLAGKSGWPQARQDALSESITLHLNVRVGLENGTEAHLLNASTVVDVLGLRLWEIPAEARAAVLERYPRLGVKKGIAERWTEEGRVRPHGRARFLSRYLLFDLLVRMAPYRE